MTQAHKDIPEFTAKLLTEMAFAYTRWSKYVGKLEEKDPEFRKLVKDTHKVRYFILLTLLLSSGQGPGKDVDPEDVWPKVQKDRRLAAYCEAVVLQYAEELTLVKDKIMQGSKEVNEEERRLIRDQLFIAVFMMLNKRDVEVCDMEEEVVKNLFTELAGVVINNFKAYTSSPGTQEDLEKHVRNLQQEADFKTAKPGEYVHKEGNA